jgi:hypothetical protein
MSTGFLVRRFGLEDNVEAVYIRPFVKDSTSVMAEDSSTEITS